MKEFLNRFDTFIDEQRNFFEDSLAKTCDFKWSDCVWVGGSQTSGWLVGNRKTPFRFNKATRINGIGSFNIDALHFQDLMKAMLVFYYRANNQNVSLATHNANLIILKRWFYALVSTTPHTHPIYLNTDILKSAVRVLSENTKNISNLSDSVGRACKLQKYINQFGFCITPLLLLNDNRYKNYSNRTKNVKKIEQLKDEELINDENIDDEKLITIKAFINMIDLRGKTTGAGEKVLLNLVFLLLVTGFRSIECITLRKDALIKRPIVDPYSKQQIKKQGQPQYTLGIKYIGAKGAGERVHWVEPLAVPLVESIFKNTLELTESMRAQLTYLRQKTGGDYLPKFIDRIRGEDVEITDLIGDMIKTECSRPGIGTLRDRVYKTFCSAKIPIANELRPGKVFDIERYYKKSDINKFLASKYGEDTSASEEKLIYRWATSGKKHEIKYEDLLFIHEFGSINYSRKQVLPSVVIPFTNQIINNFLGCGSNKSAFEYYQLVEDDGSLTRLKSHMPRHNINTFLAIAGLSEHLQAMLMGRIDISQNQNYQHLALKQIRKSTSLVSFESAVNSTGTVENKIDSSSPVKYIAATGIMKISPDQSLESNLKCNLHSFSDRSDIARHMKENMSESFLKDIKCAFDELISESGESEAKDLLERHAVLHPLPFGSCTRNVVTSGCPARLKCQSGQYCESFELTGRVDEHAKLMELKSTLQKKLNNIEQLVIEDNSYCSALSQMSDNLNNIARLENMSLLSERKRISVNIFGNKTTEKITTLADLFAIEHLIGGKNA